jgi:hypothetical protein
MALWGSIEVEHISTITTKNAWITRKFMLRRGIQEREITQLSYEAWPGEFNVSCSVHPYYVTVEDTYVSALGVGVACHELSGFPRFEHDTVSM